MNHLAGYSMNSDQRWPSIASAEESSPKDLREPLEEAYGEQFFGTCRKFASEDVKNNTKDKDATSKETLIQIPVKGNTAQDKDQETRNTFWISVSGYEYARAYIVYRFFCDIGHIVGKCFTETNLMYLKYFSLLDCQIALSYNGQKIGYGGDITVKVKPENPVTESAIIEALEECSHDNVNIQRTTSTSTTVTMDVEENRDQSVVKSNAHQVEIGQANHFEIIRKRVGIMQWFREKLSYMFYFY